MAVRVESRGKLKKPMIRPGMAWLGLLLGFLFIGGAIFLAHQPLTAWFLFDQAQGEVIGTAVVEKRSTGRGTGSTSAIKTKSFRPVIAYRYSVEGHEFESNQYDFYRKSASRKWAEKVTSAYNIGDAVTVYYDPADPWSAVISRRIPLIWVMGLLFVGGAISYGCGRVLGIPPR